MRYSQIEIPGMPHSTAVSSAKRGAKERAGVHAWLPYYAGYSSAFVSDMIDHFGLASDSLLLDPMNGSGTTTMVASGRGVAAIGFDANPVMTAIARAKDPVFAHADRAEQLARSVIDDLGADLEELPRSSEAKKWFSVDVYSTLKAIDGAIGRADLPLVDLDRRVVERASLLSTSVPTLGWSDFLRAALILSARTSSSARTSKNPTWVKPGRALSLTSAEVGLSFISTARRMATDLVVAFDEGTARSSTAIIEGDAKELAHSPVADGIVTSPPYLTRIDYAVSTAPELVFLGYDSREAFRSLRKAIMGSTCIVGGDYTPNNAWGATCLRVLSEVEGHASKASATYYLKQFVQYFRDAWAVLTASMGILKPGGRAALVVQDSWYKDVAVPLGAIYVEMAQSLGAEAHLFQSEEVRVHMGLVNTRARAYDKGDLYEHVVLIRKAS